MHAQQEISDYQDSFIAVRFFRNMYMYIPCEMFSEAAYLHLSFVYNGKSPFRGQHQLLAKVSFARLYHLRHVFRASAPPRYLPCGSYGVRVLHQIFGILYST